MNYDPFDLIPPKSLIKDALKQLKSQAYALLTDIADLRQNELAYWLIERKHDEHQKLVHKIKRYQMYLDGINVSSSWNNAVEQARKRSIQDFYVGKLRKSAGRLVGKCPFHEEKTGSFIIYPNNTYFCFGYCQIGGDVISYIQRLNNCNFKEAIKILNV